MHRAGQEDDPLLQQAREDIIGALAPAGLLDHHGHKGIHVKFDRISHFRLPVSSA